jgi:hypothetical protein
MDQERVIAVGLLTRRDLNLLGPTFTRVWPVEELRTDDARGASEDGAPAFPELLAAIDRADEELRAARRRGESGEKR